VLGVEFGLGWIRRRQRSLARAVLGLFCAAWLQAAIVPCVMAHDDDAGTPLAAPVHQAQESHGGHDHAAMLQESTANEGAPPCLYCPPDHSAAGDCDGHGGCAYPHEPQVDARAAGALFVALPVSYFAPLPSATLVPHRTDPSPPDVSPKVSFAVSYCRFIE
jgi:hypothetical protein